MLDDACPEQRILDRAIAILCRAALCPAIRDGQISQLRLGRGQIRRDRESKQIHPGGPCLAKSSRMQTTESQIVPGVDKILCLEGRVKATIVG